jgi:tRNA G18 (ribose-2'-O)-methylase SpoU
MSRGFCEVGIYHTKTEVNVGTLWRSAYQLGAMGVFTIGKRYKQQSSDTTKVWKQIPLRHYVTVEEYKSHMPFNARLIGIEMNGKPVDSFWHPEQAIYLLGAEDYGLPQEVQDQCHQIISLESLRSLSYNVAVAGSIILYHRMLQFKKN